MKERVFERVKKYFSFLDLSDKELLLIVDNTFNVNKTEDENFNKVLVVFFSVLKESYKNGDISLILSSNKFYYDDISKAVKSLNDFSRFLDECNIKFDYELENKIKEYTLDLDKTLKIIFNSNEITDDMLSKSALRLISNSSYSLFNTLEESEKLLQYEHLLEVEYDDEVELTDDNYEKIINEVSFSDDSTKQYFREIEKIPRFSEEEEKTLYYKYKETKDPKIRKRLIEGNLRLVISIASKYKTQTKGFTLLELISIGNEGLFRAIDYYDPKIAKFSTYATRWIKQKILREIQNDCTPFRIPANLKQDIFKFKKNRSNLEMEYGRILSLEELSQLLGLSVSKIKHYERLLLQSSGVSMEMPVGEEEDTKLIDFIQDPDGMTPEESVIFNDRTNVDYLFSKLNETEKMIVSLRTGLYDGTSYSFEEVSERLFYLGLKDTILSRQRIEQLESRALEKMKKAYEIQQIHSEARNLLISRNDDNKDSNQEINRISVEFLKLIKLIRITDVTVLSKSIAELPVQERKILKLCFGENIAAGVPMNPSIDLKREATSIVFPNLRKNIFNNERLQKEVNNDGLNFPRNLYEYYSGSTHYDIDKAIEKLSPSDRLFLAKCYNFYTGNYKVDNDATYNDKKCVLMVLRNIEFNLPKKRKTKCKRKNS